MSHLQLTASRALMGMVLVGLWAGANGTAPGSDPKKPNRPFGVDVDDDGIKIFTVVCKKPGNDAELLPAAPKALPRSLSSSDLAQITEIGLEDPLARTGSKEEVIENLEFRFATVNHFNLKKTDGFLHALLGQRPDLAGLPFKMGAACRMPEAKAHALGAALGMVRGSDLKAREFADVDDFAQEAMVLAVMQIHGPKAKQDDLARLLSMTPHVEATRALARLALFSPDEKTREMAARALKVRREQDYTSILLGGLSYPLPAVARRAVEALVRLKRTDLLPELVAALESPDPRLPFQQKDGLQARELVRINHHRNCLLCHPPAHTRATLRILDGETKVPGEKKVDRMLKAQEKLKLDTDNLRAPAPLPNRAFEQGSGGYRNDGDLDHILVRVDVTYLRQDFSALLPVEDAGPWPDFQRFDFVVRTRNLTESEAVALRKRLQPPQEGALSHYHQAALFGLRELTGLEATTAADWRRLLKLPLAAKSIGA